MNKAQSAFKASGIWPFHPNKLTNNDFLPSTYHLLIVVRR